MKIAPMEQIQEHTYTYYTIYIMYTNLKIKTHAQTHVFKVYIDVFEVYALIYVFICIHIHEHVYICMYICTYIYLCVYIHIYVFQVYV